MYTNYIPFLKMQRVIKSDEFKYNILHLNFHSCLVRSISKMIYYDLLIVVITKVNCFHSSRFFVVNK